MEQHKGQRRMRGMPHQGKKLLGKPMQGRQNARVCQNISHVHAKLERIDCNGFMSELVDEGQHGVRTDAGKV